MVRRQSLAPTLLFRGVASMLTPIFSFVCDRDTSNRPSQVTNPVGTLVLGYLNADGSGGENLDVGQLI